MTSKRFNASALNLNETVPGLTELVKKDLDLIQEKGMLEAVKTIL
ncbi:hypothetical protein [Prevotella sp. AM34-19LB]|nr:hypothetical protein [Prevotella sp. AM34-19LB]